MWHRVFEAKGHDLVVEVGFLCYERDFDHVLIGHGYLVIAGVGVSWAGLI